MRTVSMSFLINADADEAYALLADFSNYQVYADAVNKVEISEIGETSCVSAWDVKFRDGLLRWSEQDQFFPDRHRIEFYQIKGDLDVFEGWWQVEASTEHGVRLEFVATLDMGLPQLEKLLEPIAEQALRENMTSIVKGLFRNSFIDNTKAVSDPLCPADDLVKEG